MLKKLSLIIFISSLFAGCASVPMSNDNEANRAKEFNPPSSGRAGLYIYRADTYVGSALKKDVWVDGKCIGETARGVFFYEEVSGGKEHKISTESEFSPNDLMIKTDAGKHYFIEQFIKFGAFVGGAGLKLVDEKEGRQAVVNLGMATKGTCSN